MAKTQTPPLDVPELDDDFVEVGGELPAPPALPAVEAAPQSAPSGLDADSLMAALEQMLPGLIDAVVERRLLEREHASALANAPQPPKQWQAVYRCDQTPTLWLQKYDFLKAQKDRPKDPAPHLYRKRVMVDGKYRLEYPYLLPGQYIKFKGGYFKTDDPNEIAQIEWSIAHPAVVGDSVFGKVVGGNPTIYRGSQLPVYTCRMDGCGKSFASQDELVGHMNATHRVVT